MPPPANSGAVVVVTWEKSAENAKRKPERKDTMEQGAKKNK